MSQASFDTIIVGLGAMGSAMLLQAVVTGAAPPGLAGFAAGRLAPAPAL